LTERFQRRRLKCEKLTDRRRTPSDGKSSLCLWQGELKITFCKNIRSVLVLVNHNFLILGGKRGGGFNVWTEFVFTTNHNFLLTKTLLMMIMKMNVMISRMSFLILNKY
jgi:hypothetical protein